MFRPVLIVSIAGLAIAAPLPAFAADEQGPASPRQERMEHMDEFVRSLAIARTPKGGQPDQLNPEMVLIYADAARDTSDSTLWLWLSDGRPRALTSIEYYPKRAGNRKWTFEFATLSPDSTAMTFAGARQWTLAGARTLDPIPSATARSGGRARRLLEMKQLARRFHAVATEGEGGRIELRLLPNPVYRYPEKQGQAADGAVFVFAYGTNPEVVLLIESAESGDAEWRYSLAALTASRLLVSFDAERVWDQPRYTGRSARDTYTNGLFPATALK